MRTRLKAADLILGLGLVLALLGVAWLALRTSIVEIMPPTDRTAARLAPRSPEVVLDRAMVEFLTKQGTLSAATFAEATRAAQRAPLDARPYLFAGARDMLRGDNAQAIRTLEAGRRLNGRQRWIRLLLLDRYLRSGRYAEAAEEFAVLNRLTTAAQAPILTEMARMARNPATRDAVRQTLARDPALEVSLLTTLARNDPDPALLLSMASAQARAAATRPNGWGQALVESLVGRGRIAQARAVWVSLFRIPPEQAALPLFNPRFDQHAASPPFDWSIEQSPAGAATPRNGQLMVDYYGREDAMFVSQLLALKPGGRYRLSYAITGSAGAGLSWTLACAGPTKPAPFATLSIPAAAPAPRRHAADFRVPGSCNGQWLRLAGTAAEFPMPLNVAISDLSLVAMAAQ